jgi:Ca2+-binding RTX toxin-like protein
MLFVTNSGAAWSCGLPPHAAFACSVISSGQGGQMSIPRVFIRVVVLALLGGFVLGAPGAARADTCVVSGGVIQGPALITGTAGPDTIDCTGVAHFHTINGMGGDDIIKSSQGNSVINGGGGNDTITGTFADETINGGPGADTISPFDGDDIVHGDAGSDVIEELPDYNGDDQLWGDTGNDLIIASAGDDLVRGGPGNDFLDGDNGVNPLTGADDLRGGGGNDIILGREKDDLMLGGPGFDFCDGGPHLIQDTQATCELVINVP